MLLLYKGWELHIALLLIAALLFLTSCSLPSNNLQGRSGTTEIVAKSCPTWNENGVTGYEFCDVVYKDGKERENVSITLNKDGTFKYEVGKSLAIESQNIRAVVEIETINALERMLPAMVESAVKGAMKGIVPLP